MDHTQAIPPTQPAQDLFQSWALVEIFGRKKVAGLLQEVTFCGTTFARVDIPETEKQPARTVFYNGQAIYSVNPCDEETARALAERFTDDAPVSEWSLRRMAEKLLPEPDATHYDDWADEDDWEDDDDPEFHDPDETRGRHVEGLQDIPF